MNCTFCLSMFLLSLAKLRILMRLITLAEMLLQTSVVVLCCSGISVILMGRGGGWLLCLVCLPGVSWWLGGSSLQCLGVFCICDCGIS